MLGRGGAVIHGDTPIKQRQKIVADFQADDGPPFLVLTFGVGGTGFNLTAACHVILFDRWWNPAVENQAMDRRLRYFSWPPGCCGGNPVAGGASATRSPVERR